MSWNKIPIRADRQQFYYDAVLMTASEAGGPLTLDELVAEVAESLEDLPLAGNVRWNASRAVTVMVREGELRREGRCIRFNAAPLGAQQVR